ncbi:MAG: cysteine--tRNA ligase [Novosphingobium sp.]
MLRIYDSLTRETRAFEPLVPGQIGIYVCGQTVYDAPHLGHARKDLGFDVVVRWLEASGYKVTYVRNLTDIDDKIIQRAGELGEAIASFTQRMIDKTNEDYTALRLRAPDHEPRATAYVGEMIELAGVLESEQVAYHSGDLYYSVRAFDGYGKLSHRSLDDMRAGERIDIDTRKRDPMDFVLWKVGKQGEPDDAIWPSPWGDGRPGWHLECSAMARALLGKTIDIHGGGPDLRFPHHENEIAQSEAANHAPLANWWMHVGQLDIGGDKMSKSLGNFTTLEEAITQFGGDVVRFYFVRTHYRSPVNFSLAGLEDAASGLERLHNAMRSVAGDGAPLDWDEAHAARFRAAMDEDFNAPAAMGVLFELVGEVNRGSSPALARQLVLLAGILGLGLPEAVADPEGEAIQALVEARSAARAAKDYAEADRIRAELDSKGVIIDDTPNGTIWRRTRGS